VGSGANVGSVVGRAGVGTCVGSPGPGVGANVGHPGLGVGRAVGCLV